MPTKHKLNMKKDTSCTNPNEIIDKVWKMTSEQRDIRSIYELSKNANHITFMGRVGEGVIAPIKAQTDFIRIYRDEVTQDFLVYGTLSKQLGLNYHFFANKINEWNPQEDDKPNDAMTDILVLQFENDEETLLAVAKYKHLARKYLLIYNTHKICHEINTRISGSFETTYFENQNESFAVYTKINP